MNLYIETDNNGNPINHPAFEDNLLEAFGNIPNHWEPFVRVEKPTADVYQVFDSEESTYQKIDGVWTDVWLLRDMTNDEKLAKQQEVKDFWNEHPKPNFSSWIFNEKICAYEAPIPKPNDGKEYFWRGSDNSWVEFPTYPTDGKQYQLDIPTATWVEVSSA